MKKILLLFTVISILMLTGCQAKENARPSIGPQNSIGDILNGDAQESVEPVTEQEEAAIVQEDNGETELPLYESIDIDLTELTADLRYAQVFDMCLYPDNYIGKIVNVSGLYEQWKNEETGVDYKTVIITDALACCAQGIEFKEVPGQKLPVPYDWVSEDTSASEITVTGRFGCYVEDDILYIELTDAVLD